MKKAEAGLLFFGAVVALYVAAGKFGRSMGAKIGEDLDAMIGEWTQAYDLAEAEVREGARALQSATRAGSKAALAAWASAWDPANVLGFRDARPEVPEIPRYTGGKDPRMDNFETRERRR